MSGKETESFDKSSASSSTHEVRKSEMNESQDYETVNSTQMQDHSYDLHQIVKQLIQKIHTKSYEPLLKSGVEHHVVVQRAANTVIDLVRMYRVAPEILVHSVDLFYRFMDADLQLIEGEFCSLDHPEVFAIACFLISVKFREIHCPSLQDLSKVTEFHCLVEDIQWAEEKVLVSIQWNLNTPTAVDVVDAVLTTMHDIDGLDDLRRHVHFILQLGYCMPETVHRSAEELSAAALALAGRLLQTRAARALAAELPCTLLSERTRRCAARLYDALPGRPG